MASLKFKEIICLLYTGILFVSGAVLVGFSLVLCYKLFYHFKFVPTDTIGPFVVIFFLGILHLMITWVGVKGPSKEHDFFIITFVVFCALLFLAELSVGIWSLVLWKEVEEKTLVLLEESQNAYFKHDFDKKEWIRLETELHCCGLNGTQDYIEKGQIPLSCFKCDEKDLIDKNKTCLESYQVGCRGPFIEYVERLLLQVSLVGFLSGIYQVVGVVSFIMFYKSLKEERAIRAANRASRLRQSLASQRNRANPNNEAAAVPHVPMPMPYSPSAPT